jgi:hypothetical protein
MVINQIPAILDYRLKKKNKKVTPVERVQPTSYYKNSYEQKKEKLPVLLKSK